MDNNKRSVTKDELVLCQSLKGLDRAYNQDFIGVINSTSYVFSIVIDVATKSHDSREFAHYWVNSVLDSVKLLSVVSPITIQEMLKELQAGLRDCYLHDTASFLCFYWERSNNDAWCVTLGDCRLGLKRLKSIEWISPVHTAANAFGEEFTAQMANLSKRHIVTRNLNAKRYMRPDIVNLDLDLNDTIIMATDGFWADLNVASQIQFMEGSIPNADDDCSYLCISINALPYLVPSGLPYNCILEEC
jgi:serine/threonine protein phosphatase PrpC